jgi:PAS domain S-box-containing protein
MQTESLAPSPTRRPTALGDQLTALIEAIGHAVTVHDGAALVHANDAAATLLGFASAKELHDSDGATIAARYDALATDRSKVTTHAMRGPNGEKWTVTTFRDVASDNRVDEQQTRLELALSAGAMGVFEWVIDGNRVVWSPEIERMHGLEAGRFEGTFEAFQRDIHPEDRAHVVKAMQRTVADRGAHELQYRIIRPDGEVRWLQTYGHLVCDANGAASRLIGVCRDVTDQRAAELNAARAFAAEAGQREAEKASAQLSGIFNGITDPFTVLDRELRIVYINESGARMLNTTPAELAGKRVQDLAPEAADSAITKAYARVLETRRPTSIEEYYAPWDRWFEASIYPLAEGIAVYTRDVTVRKHAMELTTRLGRHAALRADVSAILAEERDVATMLRRTCEALVEHLEVAFARIWTLDETGTTLVLQASAGMYTHTDGGHRAVPVGKFKIGRIALHKKPHLSNDVQHDPEVGDPAWAARENLIAFAGYPMVVDGNVVGVLAMFSRHVMHADTTSTLGSIADVVAQGLMRRRAEIELQHRLDELARSNAELEQFAYVASHDLQEPLRMVASYNQLLARRYKGKLGQDADEFIAFTVEGVTRMQRLINDLLAYSRVGTRGGERVEVDLQKVYEIARGNLDRAIHDAGAEVTCDPLPFVLADDSQMIQLLQNLIGNAIKFHGDAPPKVHVGQRPDGAFFVRDNGIGIDPQFFERIFVIFQRLNPREKYPGTGIGLAICKKIVERHAGKIWVESVPGEGSTVLFTLGHARRSQ